MRILLINPNTSQFVTDTAAAEARKVCAPTTAIEAVTGTIGPPIIGCRSEAAIGAYAALELAATHGRDADAIVLAVSFDCGLPAIRQAFSMPVVGMTEAAAHTACMVGGRFALLTFGDRVAPLYEELIDSYGLTSRFVGVHCIPALTPAQLRDPSLVQDRIVDAAHTLAKQGADSVILGGAVFAGLPNRLDKETPIPLIDGLAAAVRMAETLVDLRITKQTTGSYQLPGAKSLQGVGDDLRALFDGFDN